MGMFDSVIVNCPECGTAVEFQSKAGCCELKRYSHRSVPQEIAIDIDGQHQFCKACGEKVELLYPGATVRVAMIIVKDEDYD